MRNYKKYEFCESVDCCNFNNNKCDHKSKSPLMCNRTAKEFHIWLKENNYEIIKADIK